MQHLTLIWSSLCGSLNWNPNQKPIYISHGGVRDNLIHCIAFEERIIALTRFDSLLSHLARILHFFSFLLHS